MVLPVGFLGTHLVLGGANERGTVFFKNDEPGTPKTIRHLRTAGPY